MGISLNMLYEAYGSSYSQRIQYFKSERVGIKMFHSKSIVAKVLKIFGLLIVVGAGCMGAFTAKYSYMPVYTFFMALLYGLIGGAAFYAFGEMVDLLQAIKDKVAPKEAAKDNLVAESTEETFTDDADFEPTEDVVGEDGPFATDAEAADAEVVDAEIADDSEQDDKK